MAKSYRHYRALAEQLGKYVDQDMQDAILDGMDKINNSSKPEDKVAWARELMQRMDSRLDAETCIKVREGCACVVSNEKSIYARNFRRLRKLHPDDDTYIDEVITYLNATAPLRRCGEVTRDGDRIYSVIARGQCSCPVLHKGLHDPISITWCHCSKGSLLSVYRQVFPDKLCKMEIVRTIATGADECCFVTAYR
ncbi:MAG: hypothetical protein JXR84_26270 [Anaerolineae bacterium]|nr:hypothetical protein [Anaerolineae bacterium]